MARFKRQKLPYITGQRVKNPQAHGNSLEPGNVRAAQRGRPETVPEIIGLTLAATDFAHHALSYNRRQYKARLRELNRVQTRRRQARGNMKHARASIPRNLRLLALVAALLPALGSAPAFADDYGDVNQLLRSGKYAEAQAKADQYLQSKPRDPQMRFIKGVIQSESGKPFDAITTFTKLTEDFPELPEPYNNLAVLYASQNQLDKARTALEMAIRTNPSYSTAHENLGDVYAKLASQAYARALQLDGNNTAVQPKLALIKELFAPNAKGQRPSAAAAPAAPAPTPDTKPVVTASAPTTPSSAATAAAPAPAATSAPAPAPVANANPAVKDVENAVRNWAAAWSSKDMSGYLGAYARDFDTPNGMSRKAWEQERRDRILGKSRISVKLHDLSVTIDPKGNQATVRFHQDYVANSLTASSRKTLEMVKSGEHWVILKERTGS